MKNTEEVVLTSCLVIGWALATIVRDLLAPMASAVLAALGYRPGPPELNSEKLPYSLNDLTTQKLFLESQIKFRQAFRIDGKTAPANPVPPHIAITHQQSVFPSPARLQNMSFPQLRCMAESLDVNSNGLSKQSLMEALLDEFFDRSNDYSSDVPTAEERSPSLKRRPTK